MSKEHLTILYFVSVPGLFTRKCDLALGLQVYNTNSILLYTTMI
jgi:hypothetical protein